MKEVRDTKIDEPAVLEQSHSGTMRDMLKTAGQVAQTDLQVLIAGEAGTGKQWLARRIHILSRNAGAPFVEFPCDIVRSHRLERDVLGYQPSKRGAPVKKGALERTQRGTLVLHHVSELPLSFQAKLVQALEARRFTPKGATEPRHFRGRVIATVVGNPRALFEEGTMGPDLYRYLAAVILNIPPLRDRREDLPSLIDRFIFECNGIHGTRVKGINEKAIIACAAYAWPGNVRELRNAIRYACLLSVDKVITEDHLPPYLRDGTRQVQVLPALMSVAKAEQYLIENALSRAATKKQAAQILGISLKTLYNKINKYALQKRFLNPAKGGDSLDK